MSFAEQLATQLGSSAWLSFPLVFAGGVLSAFNPCCVPMIPAIVMLVGTDKAIDKVRGAVLAALFIVGFALMTALFGALTTSLGLIFGRIGKGFSYAVAIIPILMALQMWGIIRFRLPAVPERSFNSRYFGAFATGVTFAFVFTPCATPILATILAFAISTESVAYGSSLLFVYGVGTGIPLIVMGSFMGLLGATTRIARYRKQINFGTACLLAATSVFMIWNTYQA